MAFLSSSPRPYDRLRSMSSCGDGGAVSEAVPESGEAGCPGPGLTRSFVRWSSRRSSSLDISASCCCIGWRATALGRGHRHILGWGIPGQCAGAVQCSWGGGLMKDRAGGSARASGERVPGRPRGPTEAHASERRQRAAMNGSSVLRIDDRPAHWLASASVPPSSVLGLGLGQARAPNEASLPASGD